MMPRPSANEVGNRVRRAVLHARSGFSHANSQGLRGLRIADWRIVAWSARFGYFVTSDPLSPHIRWQIRILRRKLRSRYASGASGTNA
eukprot:15445244-Alexandrium_andersonii.AAC.2